MQLYALDSKNQFISANNAIKQRNYCCLECHQTVRLRKGIHRAPHFYHLSPNHSCHLSGKTLEHLQVQSHLQNLLPKGECILELRFPEINRIADAAWITQKIIFEVQCSPISSDEIMQRNCDYANQGYQVVWILHDKRYNQWNLSGAELYLINTPYYFTNINETGEGIIYDQLDLIHKNFRKTILHTTPIDISQPNRLTNECFERSREIQSNCIPNRIQERLACWPLHFGGDLIDLTRISDTSMLLQKWCDVEAHFSKQLTLNIPHLNFSSFLKKMISKLKRNYFICLHMLIEKACK